MGRRVAGVVCVLGQGGIAIRIPLGQTLGGGIPWIQRRKRIHHVMHCRLRFGAHHQHKFYGNAEVMIKFFAGKTLAVYFFGVL
jgi:hypothetical protein